MNKSRQAKVVSAADKLHNARCILADYRADGEKLWGKFNAPREGTLWYYRALVDAFRKAGTNPLVEELARVVETIEREAAEGLKGAGDR